ncbi:Uncharacterised protein [Kingella potus]|uniref:Uncharacterized protein n=1 Tax=Kingella potus TaxID=265175 RepID=A0A377R378_9NEIS|nr:Uncharacterised protein [Kingella potus]
MLALSLGACKPETAENAALLIKALSAWFKTNKQNDGGGAVHQTEKTIPDAGQQVLADRILAFQKAEQSIKNGNAYFDYTPVTHSEIYYFDRAGKPVTKKQAEGYYRKVLGKTGKGNVVAQDFYSDTAQPQTSPFILKPNIDIQNFSAEGTFEGVIFWFDKQGKVSTAASDKNNMMLYNTQERAFAMLSVKEGKAAY